MCKIFKRKELLILLALFLTVLLSCPAAAAEIRQGDLVLVNEANLKGPLFAAGNNITINANVQGDVYCAGQNITVNGRVDGDLIAAGQLIRVNGIVSGDIRAAGNQIEIGHEVEGSVTGFANAISILQGAKIKRDVLLFGNTIQEFGIVDGQFLGSAGQILINGTINNDVKIWNAQKLSVGPTAVINGSLAYGSTGYADISPQARVGSVIRDEIAAPPVKKEAENKFSWWGILGRMAVGFLIWGAAYLLFPQMLPGMGRLLKDSPGQTLGWGFLMLMIIPVAALMLIITLIGIPLGLVLIIVYIFVVFTSKISVGDAMGRHLAERFGWEKRVPFILTFAVTYLILLILARIPVLGFLANLIISSLALGMVALSFTKWRRSQNGNAQTGDFSE